jgi:hypothetical protein
MILAHTLYRVVSDTRSPGGELEVEVTLRIDAHCDGGRVFSRHHRRWMPESLSVASIQPTWARCIDEDRVEWFRLTADSRTERVELGRWLTDFGVTWAPNSDDWDAIEIAAAKKSDSDEEYAREAQEDMRDEMRADLARWEGA